MKRTKEDYVFDLYLMLVGIQVGIIAHLILEKLVE